jgi:TonB family protein
VPEPEHRGASWCLYGMAAVKSLRIGGVICIIAILMHSCDWSVPPPPRLPIRDSRPHATVRVNRGFLAGRPIHVTQPKMPPNTKRAGIKPLVILEINIDEAGNVSVLRTVSGDPLLNDAAVKAVEKWKYEPSLFNGHPTATVSTVVVNFQSSASR